MSWFSIFRRLLGVALVMSLVACQDGAPALPSDADVFTAEALRPARPDEVVAIISVQIKKTVNTPANLAL